jgi:hypothetical protein
MCAYCVLASPRITQADPGRRTPPRGGSVTKVMQQLRREGLTGMHLLRTFFSGRIQPLHQRVTKMWLCQGPSCLDCSFSKELSEVEINTQIHKVLDHGANLNPGAGPAPLREGVPNTKIILLAFVLALCVISSTHHTHDLT